MDRELVVLPRYELPGGPPGPGDRDSIDTDAIIRFLRKSWRLCLIWLSLGICAGIAVFLLAPAKYSAFATILFDNSLTRPAAASVGAAEIATAFVDSQVQVLQSNEVLGRVVDRYKLIEDEEFGLGKAASDDPEARHATILRVGDALDVRRVGISNAVEVVFTSHNRLRAAEIANAVVNNYIEGRIELKRQAAAEWVGDLRERLAELRNKAFAPEAPQEPAATAPRSGQAARARFREMQDSTETYRALYNNLLQRANTELDPEHSSVNARIITPAEPPLRKSRPKLLVLGVIAGAALAGVGHALLREVTDKALRTGEDVELFTGLDRIAVIPRIQERAWIRGEHRSTGVQPAYVSAAADFCRPMVKLAFGLLEGQAHRSVIAVVSPNEGVGASSVAAHLANILAESGRNTLLIDANWRKPPLGLPRQNGDGERMLARGLAAIHLEPGRLDVLVLRATAPISPVNASLSILATLQHQRGEYECVVLDFHAADQTADLEGCLGAIDDVVVVVESGRTSADELRGLLRTLPTEKLAAVVMNKIAPGPPRLREELAAFVKPLALGLRVALAPAAFTLDRLGRWKPSVRYWIRSLGFSLGLTSRVSRR